MTKLRGLGRGIDSLITPSLITEGESTAEVAINDIIPNKFQPRRVFDEESLVDLSMSIERYGVLQPVVVRRYITGYELVAGERRWRAARLAGLKSIPAVVRDYTDGEMTEIALIENIQRENLNVIEEALAYRQLMDKFGLTQEEVAKKIGRSRSMIANVVRLLNLDSEVQEHVSRGTLSMGQARPLLSLADREKQVAAANKIIEEELSSRDAEELVKRMLEEPKAKNKKIVRDKEVFVGELEERLKLILGTQVKIKPGKLKSKIEIEFYSPDDLERIIEVLMAKQQSANNKYKGNLVV